MTKSIVMCRVDTQGCGDGIEQPELWPRLSQSAQKQPTAQDRPKEQGRIAAGVLAKPDVMVGECEQSGREQRFRPLAT